MSGCSLSLHSLYMHIIIDLCLSLWLNCIRLCVCVCVCVCMMKAHMAIWSSNWQSGPCSSNLTCQHSPSVPVQSGQSCRRVCVCVYVCTPGVTDWFLIVFFSLYWFLSLITCSISAFGGRHSLHRSHLSLSLWARLSGLTLPNGHISRAWPDIYQSGRLAGQCRSVPVEFILTSDLSSKLWGFFPAWAILTGLVLNLIKWH